MRAHFEALSEGIFGTTSDPNCIFLPSKPGDLNDVANGPAHQLSDDHHGCLITMNLTEAASAFQNDFHSDAFDEK